jgi:hypothetical protein
MIFKTDISVALSGRRGCSLWARHATSSRGGQTRSSGCLQLADIADPRCAIL